MEKSVLTLPAVLSTVAVLRLQGRCPVKRLTSIPPLGGVRFSKRTFDQEFAEPRQPKHSFATALGQGRALVMQSAFGRSR